MKSLVVGTILMCFASYQFGIARGYSAAFDQWVAQDIIDRRARSLCVKEFNAATCADFASMIVYNAPVF
jgi:hypothetical protein